MMISMPQILILYLRIECAVDVPETAGNHNTNALLKTATGSVPHILWSCVVVRCKFFFLFSQITG